MKILQRTIVLIMLTLFPFCASAQEELLERFGIKEITPEMQALISAFLKHRFEVRGTVKGVDDFEPVPYVLPSANVQVICEADTTQFGGTAVGDDGSFKAYIFCRNKLKDFRVRVRISYIGMEALDAVYTPVPEKDKIGDKLVVDLGEVVLKSKPMTIEEAEIVGELQKMYQRGDTTIFNAEAYEMPSGSVLLDLVRRLPGLRYEGGSLTYLGQDITEMRLNGDTFFKHDISVALQNMPHDKIKSLKVYEVPDDTLDVNSEDHLVMDLQTKFAMDNVDFANASAGITDNLRNFLFAISGNTYVRGGAQMGLGFNTNDLPDTESPTERNVNTNASVSYERKFGNVSLDASFSHGYHRTDTRTEGFSQIFLPGFSQKTESNNFNSNQNYSYNGSLRLDGTFRGRHNWYSNVRINTGNSKSLSDYSNTITDDLDTLISTTRRTDVSRSNHKNVNWNGGLNFRLGDEKKNEIGVRANADKSEDQSATISTTNSLFAQQGNISQITNRTIARPSDSYGLGASAFFNHHFGEKSNWQIAYGVNYNDHSSEEVYHNTNSDGTLQRVDSLSSTNGNHTLTHDLSSNLNIENTSVDMRLGMHVRPTSVTVDEHQYLTLNHSTYRTTIFAPSAQFKFKIGDGKSDVTLKYNGSNSLPSVRMLTATTDYSDPMNVYAGNSHLKEAFRHNAGIELRYKALLRATVDYSRTENQTTMLTTINPATGARFTTPENINGNWNIRSYLFLTKQIDQISFNAIALHTFNNNVSFVQSAGQNEVRKSATKWNNYNFMIISGYTDANWIAGGMLMYNIDNRKNDYMKESTNGQSVNARLELRYTSTSGKLALINNLTFRKTFGYELASANTTEYIWNASVEYKILKKRGTLGLQWNDILNQNKGFSASMSDTQWNETRTLGNTSYLLLTFAYKLSLFN